MYGHQSLRLSFLLFENLTIRITFWNEIGISFTISCVSSRDDSRKIKKDDEFWHILKHKIPGCMSKLHRYELNRYGRAWPEKSDIPLEIARKSVRLDG